MTSLNNHKNPSDKLIVIALLVFSFYIALARFQISQAEDFGIFLSVFGFLNKGYKLYAEVFELKDPLFLWSGSLLVRFLGPSAPYLLDLILIPLTAILGYIICINLSVNRFIALFGSVILTLTAAGNYYSTMRSTLFALTLVMLSMLCIQCNFYLVGGIIIAAVAGFKLPYLIFCVPFGLIVFSRGFQAIFHLIFGFTIGCGMIISMLLLRGEWGGYLSMVMENFHYKDVFMEVIGKAPGFTGHFQVIQEITGGNILFLIIIAAYSLYLAFDCYKNFGKGGDYLIFLSILPFLSLLFLSLSGMWAHHFQIMALFAWPVTVILLSYLYAIIICGDIGHSTLKFHGFIQIIAVLKISISLILLGFALRYSGLMFPERNLSNIIQSLNYSFYLAPEVIALDRAYKEHGGDKTFFRLGANDDSGFGFQIGDDWRLSCPRVWQYGQETRGTTDATLECLKSKPRYVVVSPSFNSIERAAGEYSYFKKSAQEELVDLFNCNSLGYWQSAMICIRKN